MGRTFSPVQRMRLGSDASVDNFTSKTHLAWVQPNGGTNNGTILSKTDGAAVNPTGWTFQHQTTLAVSTGHLSYFQDFSVTDGSWVSPNNSLPTSTTVFHHAAAVYSRGSPANNPTMYIDSSSVAVTTLPPAPNGTGAADAAQNLTIGGNDGANAAFSGTIGHVLYDDTLFTAGDVNRHRWWGTAPGGPSTVSVCLPMWVTPDSNKGTATVTVTFPDTTPAMESVPKVERMYAGMMGVGR